MSDLFLIYIVFYVYSDRLVAKCQWVSERKRRKEKPTLLYTEYTNINYIDQLILSYQ